MCTICAALRPDDLAAPLDQHAAAQLPVWSLSDIGNQLISGYWESNGEAWRRFDLDETRTLTVDFGTLGEKERFIAQAALSAWADVTGITFSEFASQTETRDIGQTRATAVDLAMNSSFKGSLGTDRDVDAFAITLEAGKTYTFSMAGTGWSPLSDPLIALKDANGTIIGYNDDANSETFDSQLVFTAETSGTYYLFAGKVDHTVSGDYTVTVAEGAGVNPGIDLTFDNSDGGAYSTSELDGNTILSSYINVNKHWDNDPKSLNSYWFQTYIHEIGHALGLGHAGNYNGSATFPDDASYANDSVINSIMSYFFQVENTYYGSSDGYLATVMPADILAIQALYGTDVETRAGNTVYGANSNVGGYLGLMFAQALGEAPAEQPVLIGNGILMTLHDTGGHDLLDLSPFAFRQQIRLTAGQLSSIGGGQNNMAISLGTVVEDARGGTGADLLAGNRANNLLDGGQGRDTLQGGVGQDTLQGGTGDDRLQGGAGRDTVSYATATAGVTVSLGATGPQTTGAGRDTLLQVENLDGSAFADRLTGNGGANALWGQDGADSLLGGDGNDTLDGGASDDVLTGGAGADLFVFTQGQDRITDFTDDADSLQLAASLWGGAPRSIAEVLQDAAVVAGSVVFSFATGAQLTLEGLTTISLLEDDLILI